MFRYLRKKKIALILSSSFISDTEMIVPYRLYNFSNYILDWQFAAKVRKITNEIVITGTATVGGTGTLPQGNFNFYIYKNGVKIDERINTLTMRGTFNFICTEVFSSGTYHIIADSITYMFEVSDDGKINNSTINTGTEISSSNINAEPKENYLMYVAGGGGSKFFYKITDNNLELVTWPTIFGSYQPEVISISKDSKYIAFGSTVGSSYYVRVFRNNGDSYTQLTLSEIPATYVRSVKLSSDGTYLAVGLYAGAGSTLLIYKRNGDTYQRLSLATNPNSQVYNLSFNDDATILISSEENSYRARIYQRTNDTFSQTNELLNHYLGEISPNGKYIVFANNAGGTYLRFYKYNNSILTQLEFKDIGATADNVAWSPCSNFIAFALQSSPYLKVYKRIFNTIIDTNTSVNMSGINQGGMTVQFNQNGNRLYFQGAATNQRIGIFTYNASGTFTKLPNILQPTLPANGSKTLAVF